MDNSIDRKKARERAENESRRADLKQHADKLIQGFEKLNESHARRALWELLQNALDLSEHCKIVIDQKPSYLSFQHNGKPFTSNTLSCLIKQVSSKAADNNDNEIGQYGTGFITTHSFGRKILLTGALEEGDGFINLKDFAVDRTAETAPELIESLMEQQAEVFRLVGEGELVDSWSGWTDFSYQQNTDEERESVAAAIENLVELLPYVMTLNDRLKSITVKVLKDNREVVFQRLGSFQHGNVRVQKILVDNEEKRIFTLSKGETVVVLPLRDINHAVRFKSIVSKLFLFFPLIGTEDFGMNFVIHSREFAPTESRDGIHLKSKNAATHNKEENNRKAFEAASEMVFLWAGSVAEAIVDPINLALIDFRPRTTNLHLSAYLDEQRAAWVKQFRTFELVETGGCRLAPKDVLFFSEDLLRDKKRFGAIYAVACLFYNNLPNEQLASDWTDCVLQWDDKNLRFLDIDELVEAIAAKSALGEFDTDELKQCYQYFIDHGRADVFAKKALLPNINGEFHRQAHLYSYNDIDKVLIEIASVLMSDVLEKYIHDEFSLTLAFAPYDRKQYSKDINSRIGEIGKLSDSQNVDASKLHGIVRYCSIYSSVDNTGVRGKLMPLMGEFYEIESEVISLPNVPGQELEWLTAFKWMTQIFFNDLVKRDSEWIEDNTAFLHKVLQEVYSYGEISDKVESMPLFPNQLYELCKQSKLKVDRGIPDDLKNLYNTRIMRGGNIRATLVLDGFEKYLKVKDYRTGRNLGDELEEYYLDLSIFEGDINKHPHRDEIFGIIGRITGNGDWKEYFSVFDERKANILLSRVSDGETKNDLFKIIGLAKDKIATLSELSGDKNMERIIELGREALQQEAQLNSDFQWKYTIGKSIENMVREKLKGDLTGFRIEDAQAGQDIIFYIREKPLYYVEVKSRWNIESSITMSPVQIGKAVSKKSQYALCCVDLADYCVGEPERFTVVDISQVLDRIFFLNDIGARIEPLIERNLSIKDLENEISLSGDYRAIIPQSVARRGKTMDAFCGWVAAIIEKEL